MPRLFTALEIPIETALRLTDLQGGLPGARWISPENFHLTLRFVGDVDGTTADRISDILGAVDRPSFELQLTGLGAFGGRRPRTIFAQVRTNAALRELQAEQERLFQRLGLPPESRKFTPHVTLARLRNGRPQEVADYLALRGGFTGPPFAVSRFVLFSSRDSVGGGPYIVEQAYPLRAETADLEETRA